MSAARAGRLAEPALLCALGAVLAWWTRATWPDVLVDAGREAYVAWQLAVGRRLYADVAYLNGPLSPYWNALWLRAGGIGLSTLFAVNIAMLALLVLVLHRLLVMAGGRLSATVACAFFLAVLAFGQKVGVANYNYVFPYSHEMTHGLLLGLIAVLATVTWVGSGRPGMLGIAGLTLGLVFLTKPELFLAAAVATVCAAASRRGTRRHVARSVALAVAGLLAPGLIAWALLARAMPVDVALRGTLGAWPWVLGGQVRDMPFYRAVLGIDDVATNVVTMARVGAVYLALGGTAVAVAFAARRLPRQRIVAAVAFAATTIGMARAIGPGAWGVAGRALPLAMLVLAAALVGAFLRRGRVAGPEEVVRLALVALALGLLGKMLLCARLEHYGFVLAMPAACVLVAAAVGWIPDAVARAGGIAGQACAVVLGALLAFVVVALRTDHAWLERKTSVVGHGADAFRADARGESVAAALDELARRLAPADTVVALPEGAMLNYLARRANPTPYVTFMPPELAFFGEAEMVSALAARPPEWVVLVDKDTSEYGVSRFGRDYGRRLFKWMKRHYEPAVAIGSRPLRGTGFGIELWQRTPPST